MKRPIESSASLIAAALAGVRVADARYWLNADHAASLVAMAQTLGGYPDATAALCTDLDRYGLDLRVTCPRGIAYTRVGFAQPIDSADELRSATAELARVARQS